MVCGCVDVAASFDVARLETVRRTNRIDPRE